MGIGYSGNYAFDKEIKSNSKSIKIEGESYNSFIKTWVRPKDKSTKQS